MRTSCLPQLAELRPLVLLEVVLLMLSGAAVARGQQANRLPVASPATLRALEAEMLAEINLLRADPADYARRFVAPLRERLERVPADEAQPFQAYKAFLPGGQPLDYIQLDEGESEDDALALVDETIAALEKAAKPGSLERLAILDEIARFFSADYLQGGSSRPMHVDSLGRLPGERIAACGATRAGLEQWQALRSRARDSRAEVHMFQKDGRYFWFEPKANGGYRYWSVSKEFGEFIAQHGQKATIPILEQEGFLCALEIDVPRTELRCGDQAMRYPFSMPIYGENFVWGQWSRQRAARGLVLWWVLDPGILNRGHRAILLDADFKFCGIGCAWSAATGWVATFDAVSEEMLPIPSTATPGAGE